MGFSVVASQYSAIVALPPPPTLAHRMKSVDLRRPKSAKKMSKKDEEHRRGNWIWLGGAACIITAYILFSGQVIDIDYGYEDDEDEEDEV
jgi:hypothetical protein